MFATKACPRPKKLHTSAEPAETARAQSRMLRSAVCTNLPATRDAYQSACGPGLKAAGRSEGLQVRLGLRQLRKEIFFGLKFAGVHAPAPVARPDRVLQVQHLVVHQIFDGIPWRVAAVEDAADHDGVVRGVVVPEQPLGAVLSPDEKRTSEQAVEEAQIHGFEDFVEIVVLTLCGGNALAAAGLANALGLADDGLAGREAAVARGVHWLYGLAVKLGDKDMPDGAKNALGSAFEDIRQAHLDAAFTEPDGCVQAGEAVEAHLENRH